MSNTVHSTCLGFPRIGAHRELKKALEDHWRGDLDSAGLEAVAKDLRERHWRAMQLAGLDLVPSNDFSLYDHMLDMLVTLGAEPERYRQIADPHQRYFAMARGLQTTIDGVAIDVPALEMTKWFDTNYHYIVPELTPDQRFTLDASRILRDIAEAKALGLTPRPVIIGPVTFLLLSKLDGAAPFDTTLNLLDAILPRYAELLDQLAAKVEWVQLDEPALVLDLDEATRQAFQKAFRTLRDLGRRPRLMLTSYFGAADLSLAFGAGFDGIHLDLVRAPEQLDRALTLIGPTTHLSLGVVDGRNIWRTDLDKAHALVRRAYKAVPPRYLWVAPSCSLLHVPVDLAHETKAKTGAHSSLDAELWTWLAFAAQKVVEVAVLAQAAAEPAPSSPLFQATRDALRTRRESGRTHDPAVRAPSTGRVRRRPACAGRIVEATGDRAARISGKVSFVFQNHHMGPECRALAAGSLTPAFEALYAESDGSPKRDELGTQRIEATGVG